MRVGILLYDGVDLLDSGGAYEVFLTASRLVARDGRESPFEVATLTYDDGAIAAYGGLRLEPHASLAESEPLDVVVVPGTVDLSGPLGDEHLMAAIEGAAAETPLVTSVCTGAFLLAQVGALDGLPWTTHWEDIDAPSEQLGEAGAQRGVRWVDTARVVTSGGLSSGIAMALHLVDRFAGSELAERTACQLDYDWRPESVVGTGIGPT